MAILFDFNGTMVFDERFNKAAWRSFLEARIHRPVTDQDFIDYIDGRNVSFTMEHFFQKNFAKEELDLLEEGKESLYRGLCAASDDWQLAPGLVEFLEFLKAKQVPMTIVTAAYRGNVDFFFESLNLDKWFDINKVVYNDGTHKGKPEPDMYLKAADKLGVPIAGCTIFEDSKAGLIGARRSGAKQVVQVISSKNVPNGVDVDMDIKSYKELNFEAFV